ncbi:MAG: urease accessory protein UreD [Deinococcus sp.]|nr:urease accessory protein UreD [Deinococcus sp.]
MTPGALGQIALGETTSGRTLEEQTLGQRTRTGILQLRFEQQRGKTVLTRDVQKAPLMIIRPFELPCGTLMVFVVNPTGGVLGGDHSEIVAEVGTGARALILTQSATRLQPSPSGAVATQDIRFQVAAGGRLEYYPERTLPFAGSAFHQTLRADLEDGAELGLTETLASGRVLMGERLAFADYRSRVEVWRGSQRLYLDQVRLQPGESTRAPGIWSQWDYAASGMWVGSGSVNDWPAVPGQLACGHTAGGAVWLRAASARGPTLDRALTGARNSLRAQLFGARPLQIRR